MAVVAGVTTLGEVGRWGVGWLGQIGVGWLGWTMGVGGTDGSFLLPPGIGSQLSLVFALYCPPTDYARGEGVKPGLTSQVG